MKKTVLLFLVFVNFAYGYSYDDLLLRAQASIFPKILLLDKKIGDKLIDGRVIYTIVYEKNDYDTALEINKFIDANYNGHFNGYTYKINLVEFSDLSSATRASVIYSLNSDRYIEKVADFAKDKGIVAFSYDIKNLKAGLLFSLVLEKSTVLYMNKENLYIQKIDFVDSLLRMVKFIDKENS
ncbi:hypothetical protein [Sulfurimonas sp.]|uniref:hypothetical protein n=1 Tax=Sulfurimonas sp. TaxID=2022749 RepID=UPI0025D8132F|nr:hypothetical protein [Sulfurimonas sp.]MBW6488870.1 hypothetical protein [Sulfurimonas sp.]